MNSVVVTAWRLVVAAENLYDSLEVMSEHADVYVESVYGALAHTIEALTGLLCGCPEPCGNEEESDLDFGKEPDTDEAALAAVAPYLASCRRLLEHAKEDPTFVCPISEMDVRGKTLMAHLFSLFEKAREEREKETKGPADDRGQAVKGD